MQDIVIIGAGGLAREVAFLIEEINRELPTWRILGFVEAEKRQIDTQVGKYPIICAESDLAKINVAVTIGIGNPAIIQKIVERFKDFPNLSFPNLIHPKTIGDRERIRMGQGNIVCAGNIFTTDIQIGSFNLFNLSSTYGHDVQIGDYCVFNPGLNLSGGLKIGNGCLIGTGAKILQYLSIGDGATVGGGAVVTKNVEAGVTVVGIPARSIAAK